MAVTLRVADCLGPTFQSQGPSIGQLAMVIRLSGCNLSCPDCDVPFTWDRTRFDLTAQSRRITVDSLVEWVLSSPARLVVVTGGEPLLQQDELSVLATRLAKLGYRVEIETNGTVPPSRALTAATHLFLVSPKLGGFAAAADAAARINGPALSTFAETGRAVFCVVIRTEEDLAELAELEQRHGLYPIWLMPEGTRSDQILAGMSWLAQPARQRGWNLTARLHVLLHEPRSGLPPLPDSA
jgi:7-carboxy-7-deazaguanine synthase